MVCMGVIQSRRGPDIFCIPTSYVSPISEKKDRMSIMMQLGEKRKLQQIQKDLVCNSRRMFTNGRKTRVHRR